MRDEIIDALKKATGAGEIELEFAQDPEYGDYTTNIALVSSKEKRLNPRELAESIKKDINEKYNLKNVIEKIEVAGPGFINFWLNRDVLLDNLIHIETEKEEFGKSGEGDGKTVIIDYSSPNIAKPFGIGHLRSTIIGAALYNLYKTLGYTVIGDNHLGDWGTQFGKLIYMITEEKPSDLSIETLEKLYVDFHKKAEDDPSLEEKARVWFKKLEDGDRQAKEIWQKCVDVSMAEFDRIYKMLGVKIDFAFGESYYESEMKQLMNDPKVARTLELGEDGAEIIDLTGAGIKTPLMFLKKDGATTYATRDLATLRFRMRKWNPDIIIYEVGAEQTLHFQQVFAAGRILGLVDKKVTLIHTAHGLYLGSDGKKFSTRKGKTIKLEDVLNEAIERAKKLGNSSDELAKQVGIGAVKYFDLMHSVSSDVIFDWEKMMNLEGNSGPYLQYTVARTNSVAKKAQEVPMGRGKSGDLNKEEMTILRTLVRFPGIISMAAKLYSPNILANYLYDLASKYNSFYNSNRIIGSDQEEFRLRLNKACGQVLKNGLKILGIETPQKM